MPITAVTSGTVAFVRNDKYNRFDRACTATSECGNCGIGATIVRDDGARFSYCHMSRIDIAVGDQITAGQPIGATGNTGHSTGPHLHLGIKVNGINMCPQPALQAIYSNLPIPTSWQATGCADTNGI